MSTAITPAANMFRSKRQEEPEARVGCFSVEVELINHSDELFQKLIPEQPVRSRKVLGRVDTGADLPVLPESLALQLGLPDLGDTADVTLADGSTVQRRLVADLRLSWTSDQGETRRGIFEAVVEPGVTTYPGKPGGPPADMLIGALVLERLDVYADCPGERLVPRVPGRITCRA
jgi:hypothetical protein